MGAHLADNAAIQGLWVGSRLSTMEQLSIASFLHQGHTYVLYVYEDVANIPVGTIVRDANEILPESAIFQYREHATYAGFANYFRYELLSKEGGWWADTDTVCLRPFDLESAYVFVSEPHDVAGSKPADKVTNGVIKVPASSEVMAYMVQVCEAKDDSQLEWGETGPLLLQEAVERFGLQAHVLPHAAFCPIGHRDWETVLDPDLNWEFDETTYAVHLYNEMWRRSGYDKDQSYRPGCLYEELKSRYLDRATEPVGALAAALGEVMKALTDGVERPVAVRPAVPEPWEQVATGPAIRAVRFAQHLHDAVAAQRDAARAERDALVRQQDAARAERDALERQRDAARATRDSIMTSRIWRWSGWYRRLRAWIGANVPRRPAGRWRGYVTEAMTSLRTRVRRAIKRMPGATWAYRSLIDTPGSWIFRTETADWLKDPENYSRLPRLYKLFAAYFINAPRNARGQVVGAEQLHRLISWLTLVFMLRRYSQAVVGGAKVYLNLPDPRSLVVPGEIKNDSDLAIVSGLLGRGDTFVDIGANHGSFSIVAGQRVGPDGLVVAIEPQPVLAALLERSLAENHATAFEVHGFACADEEGTQAFFVPKATSGSAGIFRDFSAVSAFDAFDVTLKRFDTAVDWRAFRGRVFLKLDVEGSEIKFLNGARDFLTSCHPNILLEVNPVSIAASGQAGSELADTLSGLGYRDFREMSDPEPVPLQAMKSSPHRNVVVLSPEPS